MTDLDLAIPDMTCGSCLVHVRHAVADVPGARLLDADLHRRRIRLALAGPAAGRAVQDRLAEDGYPTTVVAGGA